MWGPRTTISPACPCGQSLPSSSTIRISLIGVGRPADASLAPPAVANAKKEAADLQAMIDAEGGDFELANWDWSFYAEKVRADKYNFDEAQLKPYFEMNNVLVNGVFFAAEKVFGITFKERTDLPRYHPDVTIWEVFEAEKAALIKVRGPFDGFRATPASVSKTCLVNFDRKHDVLVGFGRDGRIHVYDFADNDWTVRHEGVTSDIAPNKTALAYDSRNGVHLLANSDGLFVYDYATNEAKRIDPVGGMPNLITTRQHMIYYDTQCNVFVFYFGKSTDRHWVYRYRQ